MGIQDYIRMTGERKYIIKLQHQSILKQKIRNNNAKICEICG